MQEEITYLRGIEHLMWLHKSAPAGDPSLDQRLTECLAAFHKLQLITVKAWQGVAAGGSPQSLRNRDRGIESEVSRSTKAFDDALASAGCGERTSWSEKLIK